MSIRRQTHAIYVNDTELRRSYGTLSKRSGQDLAHYIIADPCRVRFGPVVGAVPVPRACHPPRVVAAARASQGGDFEGRRSMAAHARPSQQQASAPPLPTPREDCWPRPALQVASPAAQPNCAQQHRQLSAPAPANSSSTR